MAAKRGKSLTKEERVEFIMSMMEAGTWRRGRTYKLLAEEWGLSKSTVGDCSAEASRRVRKHIMDPDGIAVDVGVVLSDALFDAVEDAKTYRGERGGLKARDQILAAAKILSDVSGASAPQRHEVQTTEATPEKARQLMEKHFGKVTPKAD
jgi:hypothetical protein